ncbi:MAG: DUF945 family protein [Betaproteobacteria bacterium]
MSRSTIIVGIVGTGVAIAATPMLIGWQAERLVRARVAQVSADKSAAIRLRIDSYDRGWRGANARISVIDRKGAPLLTLPATIRHWPFTGGGPAEWVATPELGNRLREALGPWGEKLPDLTTSTQLSWNGDLYTRIESSPFKRRVPEVAGGTFEIAAIAGTVDWRRDGTLKYEINLPVLRIERLAFGRTGAPDMAEFKGARLAGEGALGVAERQWNQKGSLTAASMAIADNGISTLTATMPAFTFATRDEGAFVGMQYNMSASTITANNAVQNFTNGVTELYFDARHLAKEPLNRMLDAAAKSADRSVAEPPPQGKELDADQSVMDMLQDLLRGSPTADMRYTLKGQEGRIEFKLAVAFDGQDFDPNGGLDAWLRRLTAELNARATTALVIKGTRAGTEAAAGMMGAPRRHGGGGEPAPPPPQDTDAVVQQQLRAAEAQGWVRIEGNEVATTVEWKVGHLTINGKDMDVLRDLARGITGR